MGKSGRKNWALLGTGKTVQAHERQENSAGQNDKAGLLDAALRDAILYTKGVHLAASANHPKLRLPAPSKRGSTPPRSFYATAESSGLRRFSPRSTKPHPAACAPAIRTGRPGGRLAASRSTGRSADAANRLRAGSVTMFVDECLHRLTCRRAPPGRNTPTPCKGSRWLSEAPAPRALGS